MNRYLRLTFILFTCCFILMACSDNDENVNNNQLQENELENDNQSKENTDDSNEDLDVINDDEEMNEDMDVAAEEDHYINGKVSIKEDEKILQVEAETI